MLHGNYIISTHIDCTLEVEKQNPTTIRWTMPINTFVLGQIANTRSVFIF